MFEQGDIADCCGRLQWLVPCLEFTLLAWGAKNRFAKLASVHELHGSAKTLSDSEQGPKGPKDLIIMYLGYGF